MACLSSSRLARDTKHKHKHKHKRKHALRATDPAEWTAVRQVGDHWAMSDGEAGQLSQSNMAEPARSVC
ncbi:predicted protein [Chaetomium globosum CBS 148.51]|uniref:Uncharacterized protein n=1 Tax=Chaetomium globosum (strain ATCC 6205 / CBS 148.51 / DSM 1962 / NBRC 6347 / NRRL 1970) TaxID=306901 RepID=Q2H9U0_CHAGB|nr:uncharacterized protein CHGG_03014 [Chaetomium globosum CBS 148.51]EAQ91079.1 predicted protein [Chaetomium globosum CBS 148.51]